MVISTRYVVFANGAIYWSPATGAQPLTGRIYEAWAMLRYERGPLGLPTSAEIQEPEWIVQNFQHGTLKLRPANLNRHDCDGRGSQCGTTAARGRTACAA